MSIVQRFIDWCVDRSDPTPVVTFGGQYLFTRYAPFWRDEWKGHDRPPWWRPFNILLHHWQPDPDAKEAFHDHPRWSVTICIKGSIIEQTPWGERLLRLGSIVLRSRKAIHAFRMPGGVEECWTLFVVGRRNYCQSTYEFTPRSRAACGLAPEAQEAE